MLIIINDNITMNLYYFCVFKMRYSPIFFLVVCSYYVTYAFWSESTLYSCLNVNEILALSKREIWSLKDCNWIQTHNHFVYKRTLNHLAKLDSSPVGVNLFLVILFSVLPSNFIVLDLKSSRQYPSFNFKCSSIFSFIYICCYW